MLLLALACHAPDPRSPRGDGDDDGTTPTGDTGTVAVTTASTAHTGGAEHTAVPVDPCAELSDVPLSLVEFPVETTEDFDFDAAGDLVYVDWNGNLMGANQSDGIHLVSPGDGWDSDARGVQVISTGEVLIAYISGSRVVKVDPVTGAREDLITGLSGPNALEIGADDVVYFSETGTGRVGMYDPATGTRSLVANGFGYPNGLTLAPDELTLYISDDSAGIWKVERASPLDPWGPKTRVFDPAPGESYDAMETDICGNLYSVQFYSGKLYRYNPTTEQATLILDINDPGGFLWNAIRWGADRGGWRRDTLYVTSRHKVFGLELGVQGRPQPVDLVP